MALQMQLPVPMRQLKVHGAGHCSVPPGVFVKDAGAVTAAHVVGVSFHEESPLFKRTPSAFDECCSPSLRSSPVAFRGTVYQPYQSPMTAYFDGPRRVNFGMGVQQVVGSPENSPKVQQYQQQQPEEEPAQQKMVQKKHLRNHAVAPPAQMQAAQPVQLSMRMACTPQPQQVQQIQQQPQQQTQVQNQQQQQPQQLPQACAMPVAFPFPAFPQPAFYAMPAPAAVAGANSKGMVPSTQQAWQQAAAMAVAMNCAVQQKTEPLPVPESRPAISFAAAAAITKAATNGVLDTNTNRQNKKDVKSYAQKAPSPSGAASAMQAKVQQMHAMQVQQLATEVQTRYNSQSSASSSPASIQHQIEAKIAPVSRTPMVGLPKQGTQTQSRKAAGPRAAVPTAVYIDLSGMCEKAASAV
eukprot:TRINITY_DN14846_c0_g1_i4.p1 TRINITY_DN14846_c0_g1~~TRINITY_DN14846_c0_g1_i4.p1  ORF type:complete len:438 (+),score=122.66 TRINITY_DN14846_c0_g1_i4:86-1315(+)